MRSAFASLLALASVLIVNAQTALVINTPPPPIAQCQPSLLTWGGGTGPYFINLVSGDDQSQIITNFGELSNTSLTWHVTEAPGTSLLLTIRDQTGATQNSAPFQVGSGGSTGCLQSSSASTSGSSTSKGLSVSTSTTTSVSKSTSTTVSTTAPPSTTTAPPSSSTKPTSSGASLSGSGSGGGSSSASAPTSSGGALPTGVPAAAALGALAMVAALL